MPSRDNTRKLGVILMGYGSPERLSDVGEYLSGIYDGRPVPQYAIEENMAKYRMFGGSSPSTHILETLRNQLIDYSNGEYQVFLGYKHWIPSISDVLKSLDPGNFFELLAIPLFPFPSKNVEESYKTQFERLRLQYGIEGRSEFVNGFHTFREFTVLWKSLIFKTGLTSDPNTLFLFSAHGLPNSETESEYVDSFMDSVKTISTELKLKNYLGGFQSQGKYGKNWSQPNILSTLEDIGPEITTVVTVPIGFCYDHLEILYDLDLIVGGEIRRRGLKYLRTGLPNHTEEMKRLLAKIISTRGENK